MSERGSAPIELAAGIALLVVPITLAVLMLPSWVQGRNSAEAAAAAANRVLTAPGEFAGEDGAVQSAREAASSRGFDVISVELCPPAGTCVPIVRDQVIDVRVSVLVPAIDLPGLGTVGEMWVTSSSRGRVDPYRSLP